MVTFSPKALRLIDAAVAEFADQPRQERWKTWEKRHPDIRRKPDQLGWDDWGQAKLPDDIVEIALLALDRWAGRLRDQRGNPDLSEDEVSDLDNELSHIRSVEDFLIKAPTKRREQRVG